MTGQFASRKGGVGRPVAVPIRLMIVDDSLVARTMFQRLCGSAADLEVSAVAGSVEAALAALKTARTDVILLDLEMPGTGGLEALPRILAAARGARVLVVSSLTVDGAEQTLAALSLGAADTLAKPVSGGFVEPYRRALLAKIRALGAGAPPRTAVARPAVPAASPPQSRRAPARILAIGASTGGIHALSQFFAGLPAQPGVPVLVTQHLPTSFMQVFARQLRMASGCEAFVAEDDMLLVPGRILIAPGDAHLTVERHLGRTRIRLDRAPQVSGCTPSVDPMLASVGACYGERALGVMLSGMGRDGVEGAARLVAAGGTIFAQDEASCAVWGMPRAVVEAGLASAVASPTDIAARVVAAIDPRSAR